MEDFAVKKTEKGAVSVLYLSGKMDHHTAPVFEEALKALREEKRYKIILHMGDLQYISSAGLNIIMKFIDDIRQHGGDIFITNVLPGVYRVLNLVGYTQLYKFFDDMEEALKAFDHANEGNS